MIEDVPDKAGRILPETALRQLRQVEEIDVSWPPGNETTKGSVDEDRPANSPRATEHHGRHNDAAPIVTHHVHLFVSKRLNQCPNLVGESTDSIISVGAHGQGFVRVAVSFEIHGNDPITGGGDGIPIVGERPMGLRKPVQKQNGWPIPKHMDRVVDSIGVDTL